MRNFYTSFFVVFAVCLVTYAPALKLGFYGDDFSFIETAGRLPLAQYLIFYFDPRVQTGWYRPLHGMFFGIAYALFGGNPLGYHLVQVLAHIANGLLLFMIVRCALNKWRVALIAALLYVGLPLYGVAVFWPADVDFLLAFFYLLTIFLWLLYLREHKARFYVAAIVSFVLALMTKEFGVTLPVVLFLLDRLVICRGGVTLPLMRRYLPFIALWLIYLPMEYAIQTRSVLTNQYGYGIGTHAISNFVQYLAALAFPWGLPEPINYVWLIVAIVFLICLIVAKKSAPLLFLVVAGVLAFLPVILFPWFFLRYLYMSVIIFAILLAVLLERSSQRLGRARGFSLGACIAITLIVFGNSLGVADAAADFAEFARASRVPFRDISQRHPSFPQDTYLYFINPHTPTLELSGMFFWRYGAQVFVGTTDSDRLAGLRDHAVAYVYYFDAEGNQREQRVDKSEIARSTPAVPVHFGDAIRLEVFELANTHVKLGDEILLLLYWRGVKRIDTDYFVSLNLIANDRLVATYLKRPRRGAAPTSLWIPGELIVDAIQIPISTLVPAGNYRLELAMLNTSTLEPLSVLDGDRMIIAPIIISE